MSIDKAIAELQAAILANTAAITALIAAGGGKAAATTTEKTVAAKGAGKTAATKPAHTQAEVNAALIKLKDEFGVEHAKAIISAVGASKMAEITEAKYDEAFKLAEAKYEELSAGGDGGI